MFDPEILQDFLTECGELLEQLDSELVALESTPQDPELLNKVFRALHTIKGSGSFLALTNLVGIAHAAEEALNAARRGDVVIDRSVMDLLLEAVDLLRKQFVELEAGTPLTAPRQELVDALTRVGAGDKVAAASAAGGADPTAPAQSASLAEAASPVAAEGDEFTLPESKADLLEFMVADLDETLARLDAQIDALRSETERDTISGEISHICESLARSVEFFEFSPMSALVSVLEISSERLGQLDDDCLDQVTPRLKAVVELLRRQTEGLRHRRLLPCDASELGGRVVDLVLGHAIDEAAHLGKDADIDTVLRIDGVVMAWSGAGSGDASDPVEDELGLQTSMIEEKAPAMESAAGVGGSAEPGPEGSGGPTRIEQTIRVEVSRLESLLNLVGELVLQKNRVGAMARHIVREDLVTQDLREAVAQSSSDLDRVTSDIQVAVMRTRMQSLDKLFGKYPRLIRDLSRKTDKKINLVIEGGDTEVDKSVIEELGDPLVHLLRNSADHGVEPPADRAAAGKSETGTIKLKASQQGDHVLVQIIDDGRGLDRDKLIAKAIEKGLISEDEGASMSDRDAHRLIFLPGFSTAAEVSDLSGRGVGMDVVRTNIEKLKGAIDLESAPGMGTTLSIRIPLTVAIMPAMMVGVGSELYAVPLTNILEIVRPEADLVSTINGRRVMRLRDTVLPLVSMSELFEQAQDNREVEQFAVVVELNEQRAGLMVSRLIGQQEIVIKPLDGILADSGAVSGATVRDDGGVSLIVDIARVIRTAQEVKAAMAA
ncbi:MAG: chemotaxis protein CheA [Phycisphaeraceae bacterium]|nr:MAG: chemotaxis protein CheA [Phycisphaeraceae bacterium]